MIINHNMNAMNAHRQMGINTVQSGKAMEKLSSGLRINRAGDDAAGLAISEKMRGQIRGLDQASRNAQDGISLIQTAEGALNETHSILQRMRELSVQAANDTNTSEDRGQIQKEMNQLTSEINRIGNTTEFNTQKVLNGGEGYAKKSGKLAVGTTQGTITLNKAAITIGTEKIEITSDKKEFKKEQLDDVVKLINSKIGGKGVTATAKLDDAGKNVEFTFSSKEKETIIKSTTLGNANIDKFEDKDFVEGLENGTFTGTLQIGANKDQAFGMEIGDMRAKALKISGEEGKDATEGAKFAQKEVTNGTDNNNVEAALDISTHKNATAAIKVLDNAINQVSTQRSKLGAYQNRLEHTINNLGTSSENLQAAESRVRDVDMAKEMMNFSKNNILAQAAQAMLAQANQQPQGVLQLLR